jgi:hypothetical protein
MSERRDSDISFSRPALGKRRSSSLAPVGPEPLSFEESRYKALPPSAQKEALPPSAKKEARAKAATALSVHASGQLSARKDAASLLEALKACVDENVAGDGDDSLGGQLRKAARAAGVFYVGGVRRGLPSRWVNINTI